MKNRAILGTGKVASALAAKLVSTGYDVILGSRNPEAATARWKGPKVTFNSIAEAASSAAIVINATPGDTALARLAAFKTELAGRILVTYPMRPNELPTGLRAVCFTRTAV